MAAGRRPETAGKPSRIIANNVDTGEKRPLSFGDTADEYAPVLSPDSRKLVFSRVSGDLEAALFVVDVNDRLQPKGAPRQLNTPATASYATAWTADGAEIVFSGNRTGIWRVPVDGSTPARPMALDVDGVNYPAISPRGNRMALLRGYSDVNIWRFPVHGPGKVGEPSPAISSTRTDRVVEGSYSPDGRKVAFESNRSGRTTVWVANVDGSSPSLLSHAGGTINGSPTWSPDGRWIAFDSRQDGNAELYVISADGGAMRRLTNHPGDDLLPYWSRDGKWIYFSSNRSGDFQIHKMPAGGGDPVQLTQKGGWGPRESPDGKFIYYTRRAPSSPPMLGLAARSPLLRIPVEGGEESQVADEVLDRTWSVGVEGMWFLAADGRERAELRFLDITTRKMTTAGRIGKPVMTGLALSPDGRSLLYNQVDHGGTEILLVENFR